eukprot:64752-Chlamydomonas_euryale.AAC.12
MYPDPHTYACLFTHACAPGKNLSALSTSVPCALAAVATAVVRQPAWMNVSTPYQLYRPNHPSEPEPESQRRRPRSCPLPTSATVPMYYERYGKPAIVSTAHGQAASRTRTAAAASAAAAMCATRGARVSAGIGLHVAVTAVAKSPIPLYRYAARVARVQVALPRRACLARVAGGGRGDSSGGRPHAPAPPDGRPPRRWQHAPRGRRGRHTSQLSRPPHPHAPPVAPPNCAHGAVPPEGSKHRAAKAVASSSDTSSSSRINSSSNSWSSSTATALTVSVCPARRVAAPRRSSPTCGRPPPARRPRHLRRCRIPTSPRRRSTRHSAQATRVDRGSVREHGLEATRRRKRARRDREEEFVARLDGCLGRSTTAPTSEDAEARHGGDWQLFAPPPPLQARYPAAMSVVSRCFAAAAGAGADIDGACLRCATNSMSLQPLLPYPVPAPTTCQPRPLRNRGVSACVAPDI